MPIKEMATSTATFGLLRSAATLIRASSSINTKLLPYRTLGGTVGISVCTTIFTSELTRRLSKVPGYQQFASGNSQITNDFSALNKIEPLELRQTVLHGFTRSLATIWIVSTPLAFVGLLLSTSCFLSDTYFFFVILIRSLQTALVIRNYSLKQTVIHGQKKGANDPEAGESPEADGDDTDRQSDGDATVGKQTTQVHSDVITPQDSRSDEKGGSRAVSRDVEKEAGQETA